MALSSAILGTAAVKGAVLAFNFSIIHGQSPFSVWLFYRPNRIVTRRVSGNNDLLFLQV